MPSGLGNATYIFEYPLLFTKRKDLYTSFYDWKCTILIVDRQSDEELVLHIERLNLDLKVDSLFLLN